ncbi:hypothetical protein JL475_00615 [Streptomyces sp. M2CJ-2]|uniref:hypothetical protein n=1 Tax=Streptomyces sp. M2CJ-2 TaxID=2803948 RepID=UPI001924057C|nr:hypothetical protein [Streptomyces sp. M2CJ-2]MBL3664549.1 hypothetical protein [Streptomyces sp. M2CJ-2]
MFGDDALAAMLQQVAAACMQAKEMIGPILESAEGVKADMIGRGWSEANAEAVATSYVQAMLKTALGGTG